LWDVATIHEFWSGASFHRADEGNLLSYELARIMVEKLAGNWDTFQHFVLAAQRTDAGSQAAFEKLHLDLGACVCALLEKPYSQNWQPASLESDD
jgi:hypothetical protein